MSTAKATVGKEILGVENETLHETNAHWEEPILLSWALGKFKNGNKNANLQVVTVISYYN